jgi:hypothetical protein
LDSLIDGGSGGSKYGSIQFGTPPGYDAADATTVKNSLFFSGPSTITINDGLLPDFFNDTTYAKGEGIVLHELGHLLYNLGWSSQIKPDSPGYSSEQNQQKIDDACGKYLK